MKWIWDVADIDEGRFERASKLEPMSIDAENVSGVFKGSSGPYRCTLTHCDCPDFQHTLHGSQPCKHILALGAALNAYDPKAIVRRFDGEKARDRLALAYGRYWLFNDPIMPDADYDALKTQWADLLPRADPVKSAGEALYEQALERLKAANVEYIDRISVGGGLYFFDETIANELKQAGYPVQYAAQGSKSTSNRPAWYLKAKK